MYDINIYVIDMNLWFVISYLLFVRFVITRPVSHFWLISQECRLSQFFSKIQNTSLASYNIFYKYSFSLNFVTKLFLCQIADFLSIFLSVRLSVFKFVCLIFNIYFSVCLIVFLYVSFLIYQLIRFYGQFVLVVLIIHSLYFILL